MKSKKVLLITNESSTVINFRKEFIKYLLERNNDIVVISGDNEKEPEIKRMGVQFECVPFSNRSKNPLHFFSLKNKFYKVIKKYNPDIVFTFQIKPNIVGCMSSKKAGIKNVFSMVEGLGDPFQPKTLFDRFVLKIIVKLYKKAFKSTKMVFFLNNFDKEVFINRKIINSKKAIVINGIGIDTSTNRPVESLTSEKNVLMLSRLIVNKGVLDYCLLAREVRKTRKDIHFYLYGKESQLTVNDLKTFIDDGDIVYGGEIDEVENVYKNSRIYISTSYREGFPRTLLEAMAFGIPTFATNVVGNNSAIINNETGYLFELKETTSFADAIINKIDDTQDLDRIRFAARKRCEAEFDSNVINEKILAIIDENV